MEHVDEKTEESVALEHHHPEWVESDSYRGVHNGSGGPVECISKGFAG